MAGMNENTPAANTLTAPQGPSNVAALSARFCLWRASKRAAKLALVGAATLKASNAIAPRSFAGDAREAQQSMTRTVEARNTRADLLTDEESAGLSSLSRIALAADTLPCGHGWSGEASYLLTREERARLALECPRRAKPAPVVEAAPVEVFAPVEVPDRDPLVPAEVKAYSDAVLAFEAAIEAAPLMLTA